MLKYKYKKVLGELPMKIKMRIAKVVEKLLYLLMLLPDEADEE